jgi:PPOX class probable F420-dependent enzyme
MDIPMNNAVAPSVLEPLDRSWTVLLTTYKRDGTPVGTPVNLAVEGDHAYFRSYDKAWKTKRIRNNPDVALAASTARGKPRGPELQGKARLLAGDEELHARKVIAKRHPVFHRLVIPFLHMIGRYRTMHYEVSFVDSPLLGSVE